MNDLKPTAKPKIHPKTKTKIRINLPIPVEIYEEIKRHVNVDESSFQGILTDLKAIKLERTSQFSDDLKAFCRQKIPEMKILEVEKDRLPTFETCPMTPDNWHIKTRCATRDHPVLLGRSLAYQKTTDQVRFPGDLVRRTTAGGYEIVELDENQDLIFGTVKRHKRPVDHVTWNQQGDVIGGSPLQLYPHQRKKYSLVFHENREPNFPEHHSAGAYS